MPSIIFLNELHGECSFRASPFFRNIPQDFIDCARVAYPWDNTKFTLKVTDVPPHVIRMANMEELVKKFHEFCIDIKNYFTSTLDSRSVGRSEFHTNQIIEAIKGSNVAMNTAIWNGTPARVLVPIIEDKTLCILDEDACFSDLTSDESSDSDSPKVRVLVHCQGCSKTKEAMKRKTLAIGFHHGWLQVLPPTWTFPMMNCKQLVNNWYVGKRRGRDSTISNVII